MTTARDPSDWMREVASSAVLETAFEWLCKRRVDYADGECTELWAALDALVLKALAVVLNRRLDFPRSCYHVPGKEGEGRRGAKAAVRHIFSRLPGNRFVFRSDVESYYASINHSVLLALVRGRVDDRRIMDLVAQYLHRTVDENCLYSTVEAGISLGCPLSPVMAAIYLEPLDRRMEATGLTYARFMDDWVILARTRWALRRAVRIVNETLSELRVEQHPDKTFIGWIQRGFTFLGYWITEKGVTGVAPSAWKAFQERLARLYEQDSPLEKIRQGVEQYVRRWQQWVRSGVAVSFGVGSLSATATCVWGGATTNQPGPGPAVP